MENFCAKKKLIIGMVGLPARGKTYTSRKICRYLNWKGCNAKTFNIGNYRKFVLPNLTSDKQNEELDFFDDEHTDVIEERKRCADIVLKDIISFLKGDGFVAVYDGTNSTAKRRLDVKRIIDENLPDCQLMWIESICENEKILTENIKSAKLVNPSYQNLSIEEAIADFKEKMNTYTRYYETIKEEDYYGISFVKLIEAGKTVVINNLEGYLESKIVGYIKNLQLHPKNIYLSRHGESLFIPEERIGGDPDLSEDGKLYAKQLKSFMTEEFSNVNLNKESQKPIILTSTLLRARRTANEIELNTKPLCLKILDEINVGLYDSMTFQEVIEKYPEYFKERQADKLRIRFPKGESYLDLVQRVEPVIFEIEKAEKPVIIVAHQAVLRCIYAYFTKYEVEEIPNLDMSLNTVVKLTPATYFCEENRYQFDLKNNKVTEKIIQKPEIISDVFRNI